MLQLRPYAQLAVPCPECGDALKQSDVQFAGMPVLATCACARCGKEFFLDLPAGHGLLHPAIIDRRSGNIHYNGLPWYPKLLARIVATASRPRTPEIHVRRLAPCSRSVVLVNCLDTVWGHSLLKFLSSLRFNKDQPDVDRIAIVPRLLSWIVPAELYSVIEVDAPLDDFACWIDGLDRVVQATLSEYETVYLAEAVSQPDLSSIDISILGPEFTPTPFWQRATPSLRQVTIITREDRLWLGCERLQFALLRRRGLVYSVAFRLLVQLQNRRIARVARRLKNLVPDLRIAVIGSGRTGTLPGIVEDLRTDKICPEMERQWCAQYARSDVVVGVHGSNMLLPSLLAGAVVELLPRSKLRNIAQDLIVRELEPKLCLFRYRVLPTGTAADYVADTVVSILRDADMHYLNIVSNRASLSKTGWPRPIIWRQLVHASVPEFWYAAQGLVG